MEYVLSSAKFRRLIAAEGYRSIGALCRALGIHRNTMLGYLNGESSVFTKTVNQLCKTLKVDPLEIIELKQIAGTTQVKQFFLQIEPEFPGVCFFLIGSRAQGNAREYSDWDVCVSGGRQIVSSNDYLKMKRILDDLAEDFPWNIDLLNVDQAPDWFLSDLDYDPVFLVGSRESYGYFLRIIDESREVREAA